MMLHPPVHQPVVALHGAAVAGAFHLVLAGAYLIEHLRYRGVVILKNLFPKMMTRKISSVKFKELEDLKT